MHHRAFASRYSLKTRASMRSPIKLWSMFCVDFLDVPSVVLFAVPPPTPTAAEIAKADWKLTLFANWLLQEFASATTAQYVSAVKAKHADWLGSSLKQLGIEFPRVAARLALARKQKPGKLRQKKEFTAALLADCISPLWHQGRDRYARAVTYCVMALCQEQMLRLSEVVADRSAPLSAANTEPITAADIVFYDRFDQALDMPRHLQDGAAREGDVCYFKCRMVRSKADPTGSNPDLFSPADGTWLSQFII